MPTTSRIIVGTLCAIISPFILYGLLFVVGETVDHFTP